MEFVERGLVAINESVWAAGLEVTAAITHPDLE